MNTNKKIFLFSLTLLLPLMVTEKTFTSEAAAAASADSSASVEKKKEAALQRLRKLLFPGEGYMQSDSKWLFDGDVFKESVDFRSRFNAQMINHFKQLGIDKTSSSFEENRNAEIIKAINFCLSLGISIQEIGDYNKDWRTGNNNNNTNFSAVSLPATLNFMKEKGYNPSLNDIFDHGYILEQIGKFKDKKTGNFKDKKYEEMAEKVKATIKLFFPDMPYKPDTQLGKTFMVIDKDAARELYEKADQSAQLKARAAAASGSGRS